VDGIGLYPNFPKREDPVIVIRTAVVSALFPGMAPERMENLVAVPIERKIRELPEVKDIRTLAGEGSLTIYVDLKDEIGNVNATWQRLRDKMGDVKVELPDRVVGPFVGCSLTLQALWSRASRNGKVGAKIKNVLLVAPDIDVDVFRKMMDDAATTSFCVIPVSG
jgi:multidrug efflux pump subunit AcrB